MKTYEDLRKTMECISDAPTFAIGGEIFAGNSIHIIKVYLAQNPSQSFRVWCIDQGLLIGNMPEEKVTELHKKGVSIALS